MVMLLGGSCLQSKSLWNESSPIAIESLIPISSYFSLQPIYHTAVSNLVLPSSIYIYLFTFILLVTDDLKELCIF